MSSKAQCVIDEPIYDWDAIYYNSSDTWGFVVFFYIDEMCAQYTILYCVFYKILLLFFLWNGNKCKDTNKMGIEIISEHSFSCWISYNNLIFTICTYIGMFVSTKYIIWHLGIYANNIIYVGGAYMISHITCYTKYKHLSLYKTWTGFSLPWIYYEKSWRVRYFKGSMSYIHNLLHYIKAIMFARAPIRCIKSVFLNDKKGFESLYILFNVL